MNSFDPTERVTNVYLKRSSQPVVGPCIFKMDRHINNNTDDQIFLEDMNTSKLFQVEAIAIGLGPSLLGWRPLLVGWLAQIFQPTQIAFLLLKSP